MFETAKPDLQSPSEEDAGPAVLLRTDERGAVDVRATLDRLLEAQPGPEVMSVAALLTSLHDATLTPSERIDLVVVIDRCEAWTAAAKQRVLAGVGRDAGSPLTRSSRGGRYEDIMLELALAMRWSEWMAADRMTVARELDERLPQTWLALAEGRLNYAKAREMAVGSQLLGPDEKAAALEDMVLPAAVEQSQMEIRSAVAQAVMVLDPEGAEDRRKKTRRDRRVTRRPLEDGGGHIGVSGPAEMIAAIYCALTEGARQLKATGVVDNLDQGRFDTLFDWAVRYLDERTIPGRPATPVGATIIVKASTVAGEDNDPAEVAGFGPITAQAVRDLLNGATPAPGPFEKWKGKFEQEWYPRDEHSLPPDMRTPPDEPPPEDDELPPDDWDWEPPPPSTPHDPQPPPTPRGPAFDPFTIAWRVLKVDPATGWAVPPPGVRLNYGTERRFATPAQARYVRDRDRTCGFPTCAQSGQRVDIDHRHEASKGGPTDVGNLGPGCVHHNRVTRNNGWTIEPHDDETATLTTPQGRRYRIKPHNYLN